MMRRSLCPPSRVNRVARGIAVETHVEFVEQELLHRRRALAHQLVDGLGIRGAVAGLEDVARQRRIGSGVVS
jgi:hypothetical protein